MRIKLDKLPFFKPQEPLTPSVISNALPTPTPKPTPVDDPESYAKALHRNSKAPPGFRFCSRHDGKSGKILPIDEFYSKSAYCRACSKSYQAERNRETYKKRRTVPKALGKTWCPRHDNGAGALLPNGAFNASASYCRVCANEYAREMATKKRSPGAQILLDMERAVLQEKLDANTRIQKAFVDFENSIEHKFCSCCKWDVPPLVKISPLVALCQLCSVGVLSGGYCAVHHYANSALYRPDLVKPGLIPDLPDMAALQLQDAMREAYEENYYRPIQARRDARIAELEAAGVVPSDEEF